MYVCTYSFIVISWLYQNLYSERFQNVNCSNNNRSFKSKGMIFSSNWIPCIWQRLSCPLFRIIEKKKKTIPVSFVYLITRNIITTKHILCLQKFLYISARACRLVGFSDCVCPYVDWWNVWFELSVRPLACRLIVFDRIR